MAVGEKPRKKGSIISISFLLCWVNIIDSQGNKNKMYLLSVSQGCWFPAKSVVLVQSLRRNRRTGLLCKHPAPCKRGRGTLQIQGFALLDLV